MISLFSYSKDPVKQWGQLQVKGNQLCSQTGDSIVLRGVSYGWHNLWPRFYNKQSVKWLKKDWKCTVLRAAMGTVIEDNYIENPEFALKCMNKVIKAAIKKRPLYNNRLAYLLSTKKRSKSIFLNDGTEIRKISSYYL